MTEQHIKQLLTNLTSSWRNERASSNPGMGFTDEFLKKLGYNNSQFRLSSGISKVCLIFKNEDYIIKWGWSENIDTLKEVEIYQKAVEAGVGQFFPKTEVLCQVQDIVFVKQEKVDYVVDNLPANIVDKYSKKVSSVRKQDLQKLLRKRRYACMINRLWYEMACLLYGRKVCIQLCDFIEQNCINDLHGGNIGYKNNKPIIIDFCGV